MQNGRSEVVSVVDITVVCCGHGIHCNEQLIRGYTIVLDTVDRDQLGVWPGQSVEIYLIQFIKGHIGNHGPISDVYQDFF